MLSAHTLSNGNNCLTSFLFNVVILWLTETAFAGNTYHLWPRLWHARGRRRGRAFWAAQLPGRAQKHPWSGQRDASLPAACCGQLPSISSSSSWPCSRQSGHPGSPLERVRGWRQASPRPSPSQALPRSLQKRGLWEGRERGEPLGYAFMGLCISNTCLLVPSHRVSCKALLPCASLLLSCYF